MLLAYCLATCYRPSPSAFPACLPDATSSAPRRGSALGAPALILRSRATADIIIRNGKVFDGLGGAPRRARRRDHRRPHRIRRSLIVGSRHDGDRREGARRRAGLHRHPLAWRRLAVGGSARRVARPPGHHDDRRRAGWLVGAPREPRRRGSARTTRTSFARFTDLWTSLDRAAAGGERRVDGRTRHHSRHRRRQRRTVRRRRAELARMRALVAQALADGACGASSGLEYTPGAFAPRDELIALCKPLAARRLPYATHMRNEDDRLLEAIDEAIAVARGAELSVADLSSQDAGPAQLEQARRRRSRASPPRERPGCDARSTAIRTSRIRPG